ncbi:MAG: dihydroorotate dehydrogenase (quinone) [Legionellales bacterium]|mgnify:CR=1 FL=1|jgi:dihydroorotate dehydrogenase|nr:dihydroorotate dehydrogenase (quinone) [Legionellales bacterium]
MNNYAYIRKLLFCLPPEVAHLLVLKVIKHNIWNFKKNSNYNLQQNIMGLEFKSPLGLAAGFDKDGDAFPGILDLGFGFIEFGTVTPIAQAGNPKPRLFRLTKSKAIINRMGFNNNGVVPLAKKLKHRTKNSILGVNVGKNKDTPLDCAVDDYLYCYRVIHNYADYVTINLSSPNTKGLRELQNDKYLSKILFSLKNMQSKLEQENGKYVPIAIKVAPDLSEYEVENISKLLLEYELDGVVATNTSIDRSCLRNTAHNYEQGGLSGEPIQGISTNVIKLLNNFLESKIPIIGVGGINSPESAKDKLNSGANLLQLYTGLIYNGVGVIDEILSAIDLSDLHYVIKENLNE